MTKQEFSLLAAAIRTYYSRENILTNMQAVELWYRQLQDLPYSVACACLDKWVATNKWSPSIADFREMAATINAGEQLTWAEAWQKANDAIRRFGSYSEREALESLDTLTRKTVECLGYRELCLSENQTADRANFRQAYEIIAKRQAEYEKIPESTRVRLESLAGFAKSLPASQESSEQRKKDSMKLLENYGKASQ